jgi:hypothetical protein
VGHHSENFDGAVAVSRKPPGPFRLNVKVHPQFRKIFGRSSRTHRAHRKPFGGTATLAKGGARFDRSRFIRSDRTGVFDLTCRASQNATADFQRWPADGLGGETAFDPGDCVPPSGSLELQCDPRFRCYRRAGPRRIGYDDDAGPPMPPIPNVDPPG